MGMDMDMHKCHASPSAVSSAVGTQQLALCLQSGNASICALSPTNAAWRLRCVGAYLRTPTRQAV